MVVSYRGTKSGGMVRHFKLNLADTPANDNRVNFNAKTKILDRGKVSLKEILATQSGLSQ